MDQNDLVVTADNVNSVDGSKPTFVDNCRGQEVVALIPAMILSVRERRNIKLTDPCSGSLTTAVNVAGGRYRPTQMSSVFIAKHRSLVGAGVLEVGTRGTVWIGRRRSNGGRGALRIARSPSVPVRWGHVVVMASSCGKPLIDEMGVKALALGSIDAEVGQIHEGK
jgi:hypothetical protein